MHRTALASCLVLLAAQPALQAAPQAATQAATPSEATAADEASRRIIGVGIAEIGEALAAQLGIDAAGGILITDVAGGLPAEQAGVQRFDVITAIDGHAVRSLEDLAHALAGLAEGSSLELRLRRRGESLEVAVAAVALDESRNQVHWLKERPEQHAALQRLLELKQRGTENLLKGDYEAAHVALLQAQRNLAEARRQMDAGEWQRAARSLEDQAQAQMKEQHAALAALENHREGTQARLREVEQALAQTVQKLELAREVLRSETASLQERFHASVNRVFAESPDMTEAQRQTVVQVLERAEATARRALERLARALEAHQGQVIQDEEGRTTLLLERALQHHDRMQELEDRLRKLERQLQLDPDRSRAPRHDQGDGTRDGRDDVR